MMNAPEMWKLEDMAKWIGMSEATVRKIASRPGFPEPIIPSGRGGKNCVKVWFAQEVVDYLQTNRRAA